MELVKNLNQSSIVKTFLIIILGSLALTISAKIKIPFYPVPMTMQTFVVMLLGLAFGYKIGLATVSLYLLKVLLDYQFFPTHLKKVWVWFTLLVQQWDI